MPFQIFKGAVPSAIKGVPTQAELVSPLKGKTVFFRNAAGVLIAGLVASHEKGAKYADVRLAVPSPEGVLMVGKDAVPVEAGQLTVKDAVFEERKLAAWTSNREVELDGKALAVKDKETGVITDYKQVMFAGYGSTFVNVTESDRVGDYVLPGAFKETIREFKKNPVMLVDHRNSVREIAGSYSDIREDDAGLRLVGKVSDAPGLTDVRFLLMERHLRTLSMGGIFIYLPDGRGIEKVYLFEVSLVAIPANPDALIEARGLDVETAGKAFEWHAAAFKGAKA